MKTELLEKKHIFDKFDQTLCKLQKKNVERANNASMLIWQLNSNTFYNKEKAQYDITHMLQLQIVKSNFGIRLI